MSWSSDCEEYRQEVQSMSDLIEVMLTRNEITFPYKYNIVIDDKDDVCNLFYGCMTPYFDSEKLIFYTYNEGLKQFEEHTVIMDDVTAFSITKVE